MSARDALPLVSVAWFSVVDLPGVAGVQRRPVPAGLAISDLVAPQTPCVIVEVNGYCLLREHWDYPLAPGDHLQVHALPAGNDGRKVARLALTLIAIHFLGPAGLGLVKGSFAYAAAAVLASAAINVLLPLKPPSLGGANNDSPTYNTNLSGNTAALNSPIPVIYGRVRTFPPFAAAPFVEFDDANDQYYHALFCVGMGHYDIEALQLDDTELDNFDDLEWNVLPPGTAPTLVQPNVVTSVEVAGLPLNPGRPSPVIAACRGDLLAAELGIDITFDGLGDATGSSVANKSVDVRFDIQEIDAWGVPLSPWSTLATETITAASTSPVRKSFKYTLPSPIRPQVRVIRITPRDDNPLVPNDAVWAGMRSYLSQPAPLAAGATYVEVKMRATEQLSTLSQRRFAVIARRLLYTWDPMAGWSASRSFTRNPAWAIVDKRRDTTYGDGDPDSRIDLASFHALSQVWDDRQDHLDIVFDTVTDSDEADQIMARAGRARCLWRHGVRTIWRDQAPTLPKAVLTCRDIEGGSASLQYNVDAERVPDGVVVEYFDHRAWSWLTITCPAPGVVTPTRPTYVQLRGITGSKQAEREGLYEAAVLAKRRTSGNVVTELQGLIPHYGAAVVMSLPLRGWGQSGDVVAWDGINLTVSEPLDWSGAGPWYITLQRSDGSVHDTLQVTMGASEYVAVPSSAPDFSPLPATDMVEATRFVFGSLTDHRRTMLVKALRPRDMRDDGGVLVEVEVVADDATVHTADNALLPGVDEIQDPIDSPNTGAGADPGVFIPYLKAYTLSGSVPAGVGEAQSAGISLLDDGTMETEVTHGATVTTATVPDQWLLAAPFGPADAALFEVRADVVDATGGGSWSGATLGAWLPGGVDYQWLWSIPAGDGQHEYSRLKVQVREVSSGLVQATAVYRVDLVALDFS